MRRAAVFVALPVRAVAAPAQPFRRPVPLVPVAHRPRRPEPPGQAPGGGQPTRDVLVQGAAGAEALRRAGQRPGAQFVRQVRREGQPVVVQRIGRVQAPRSSWATGSSGRYSGDGSPRACTSRLRGSSDGMRCSLRSRIRCRTRLAPRPSEQVRTPTPVRSPHRQASGAVAGGAVVTGNQSVSVAVRTAISCPPGRKEATARSQATWWNQSGPRRLSGLQGAWQTHQNAQALLARRCGKGGLQPVEQEGVFGQLRAFIGGPPGELRAEQSRPFEFSGRNPVLDLFAKCGRG